VPGPINSLRFVHAAILTESDRIDAAASAATSSHDLTAIADDVAFFEDLVLLHTRGEELGMFPVLAELAPHIDETYLFDHEDERATFAALRGAIDAGDVTAAQRAAVVLREHAHSHIEKENTLILPFVDEHLAPPEQGAMLGKILSTIPPEKMAAVVPWIINRISHDDAEKYVTVLAGALPPEAFAAAKGWIRDGVEPDALAELIRRLPHLVS
jgi:hypothetical protein